MKNKKIPRMFKNSKKKVFNKIWRKLLKISQNLIIFNIKKYSQFRRNIKNKKIVRRKIFFKNIKKNKLNKKII